MMQRYCLILLPHCVLYDVEGRWIIGVFQMIILIAAIYIGTGIILFMYRLYAVADDLRSDSYIQVTMHIIGVANTTLIIAFASMIAFIFYMVAWPLRLLW